MIAEKDLILDKKQIDQKLKRIAYEIYENNISEKKNSAGRHIRQWLHHVFNH